MVQYIDDHDQLKMIIQSTLYPYVKDSTSKDVEVDPDIKKEYVNQKKYLESSHHSLQKRLEKEDQVHRQNNLNVMQENIHLIEEIQKLREDVANKTAEYKTLKNEQRISEMKAKDEAHDNAESEKE